MLKIGMVAILAQMICFFPLQAQTLSGPDTAVVGQFVEIKLEGEIGLDPKFDLLPKQPGALKLRRDFENQKQILLQFTPSEPGTYIFLYADNKDSKTIQANHQLTVPKPGPNPNPNPNPPTPKPSDPLLNRLKAAYLVSPDADSLVKLIAAYEIIGETKYPTVAAAKLDLKAQVGKYLLDNQLKSVRDEVTKILSERLVGAWNQAEFEKVLKEISTTLKRPELFN